MARPRIFVSSTFYDLKHVRNDLDSFITSLGYDSIMNDKGQVPYSATQPLTDNCYDEASRADILIGIIGGRYGSDSGDDMYSVSMKEIQTAIRNNKQVFIFVEKSIFNEHQIYQLNKDSLDIKYAHVDNIKIHKFIEEIQALKINNAMIEFESVTDITGFLKEQFAGLFQRLLQDRATITEQTTLYDLNETIKQLKGITERLKNENEIFTNKFNGSVFAVNMVVGRISKLIGIQKGQIYASNRESLYELLENLGFSIVDEDDDDFDPWESEVIFRKYTSEIKLMLHICNEVFDPDDRIRDIRKKEQLEKYIKFEETDLPDDYVPF